MSDNKEKETIGSWASESPEIKGNNKNELNIEQAIFKNIDLNQYQAFLKKLKAEPARAEMLKTLNEKIALKKAQTPDQPQHSSFAARDALMNEHILDWQFTAELEDFFHSLPEVIQAQKASVEASLVSAPSAAKQLVEAKTKSAFQEQFEQFVDYVLDLFSLRFPKFYKLGSAVLLAIILAACSAGLPASRPVNPEQAPSPAASGETNNLPDSLTEAAATAAPLPEITQTVSAEELQQLNQDIGEKLEAAVEQTDPAIQAQYSDPQRNEGIASSFAQSLTDPENPADRVLDPRAFQVGLTPDGIAFLLLTEKNPWGEEGEVAIIDTGEDKGMFVSVTGSGVAEGKLDFNQAGYYAAVKNPLGEVKAVVDASRQWVHDLSKAEKLSSSSAWGRVVEAYLAGKIAYPAGLNAEQKIAFEKELVAAEAKLPLAEQKKLIEGRFDRSKSGVYEAVINADGKLEYFDGSWKTLEAMKNKNGENIPWGESYRLSSKEDREKFVANVLAGNEATLIALDKSTDNKKNSAEKRGFDASNYDFLYVQFYADQESIVWKDLGEKMGGYDSMEGVFVIKNSNNKLMAIKIELSNIDYTAIADLESEKTLSFSSILSRKDIYELELNNFFLGIPSATLIRDNFNAINNEVTESNEKIFLQKLFAGNLENISEKLEKNPEALTKDVIINILQIILIE